MIDAVAVDASYGIELCTRGVTRRWITRRGTRDRALAPGRLDDGGGLVTSAAAQALWAPRRPMAGTDHAVVRRLAS
jgi:hypothetical protein